MIDQCRRSRAFSQNCQRVLGMPNGNGTTTPARSSVLAAVVYDVLARESFETAADLSEAVKCRAARLRIPYDGAGVTAALETVARSRPLLREREGVRLTPGTLRPAEPGVSRADAAAILAGLGIVL